LLVSPLNVNVGPIEPDVDELELAPELEARSSDHGTATCLPEALDELDVSEALDDALDELLDPEPELLKDMMAKSTLPELGLSTTSWMVPSVSPEDP